MVILYIFLQQMKKIMIVLSEEVNENIKSFENFSWNIKNIININIQGYFYMKIFNIWIQNIFVILLIFKTIISFMDLIIPIYIKFMIVQL